MKPVAFNHIYMLFTYGLCTVVSASLFTAKAAGAAYNQTLFLSDVVECQTAAEINAPTDKCLQAAVDKLNAPPGGVSYSTLDLQGKSFAITKTIYFRYQTNITIDSSTNIAKQKSDTPLRKIQNGTLTCGNGFTGNDISSYAVSLDGIFCDNASSCNQTNYRGLLPRIGNKYLDNITINANGKCNGVHFAANYYTIGLRKIVINEPKNYGVLDVNLDQESDHGGHVLQIFDSVFNIPVDKSFTNKVAINIESADYLVYNNSITGFNTGIMITKLGQIQNNTITLARNSTSKTGISYVGSPIITGNTINNGNIKLFIPTPTQYNYKLVIGGILANNTINTNITTPGFATIQLYGNNFDQYKNFNFRMLILKDNNYNNYNSTELLTPLAPLFTNNPQALAVSDIYIKNNTPLDNATTPPIVKDATVFWLGQQQLLKPTLDQWNTPGNSTEFTYAFKGIIPKNCLKVSLEEILFPDKIGDSEVNERAFIDAIGWSVSKFNENGDGNLTLKLLSPLIINQSRWVPYFRVTVSCK